MTDTKVKSEAPTDDVLVDYTIKNILEVGDLHTLTNKSIRKLLETHFGCKLKHKKDLIKATTNDFIQKRVTDGTEAAEEEAEEDPEEEMDVDEDDEVETEKSKKKKAKKAKKKKKKSKKVKKEKKEGKSKGGWGAKELVLSPALAEFLGQETMSRKDCSAALRQYFKDNNLKNPKNGKEILLDEPLQKVFKRKKFTWFSMNKFLTPHLKDATYMVGSDTQETDSSADEEEEEEVEEKKSRKRKASSSQSKKKAAAPKKKKKTGGGGGFTAEMKLSDTLAAFVGQPFMARTQVTKKLWAYIKANSLQDPNDGREILCDDKLKELMGGREQVNMCKMNKFIQPHYLGKKEK